MKTMVFLMVLVAAFAGNFLNAQVSQSVVDRQFDMGYYTGSAAQYTHLSEKGELNLEGYLRLGQSLLWLNEPFTAESFLLIGQRKDLGNELPEFSKYLGFAAMQQGNYKGAVFHFQKYAEYDPVNGRQMMLNAGLAESILNKVPAARVYNMPWNSPGAEMSISKFNDKLVFTSRSLAAMDDCGKWDCMQNGGLLTTKSMNVYEVAGPLRSELSQSEPIVMVSYSGDGKRVAFVREGQDPNAFKANPLNNEMSIYIAEVNSKGDWEESVSFPFNAASHSNAFPFFNYDGSLLYFASNRKGGFGGFDLYSSSYINGEWQIPVNLGPEINSPGNEVSPFVSGDILFFSSDWHPGLGGLDVFYTSLDNPAVINNAGRSINSTRDDFGLFIENDFKSGFVISNRPGGRGLEDVYGFSSPTPIVCISEMVAENSVLEEECIETGIAQRELSVETIESEVSESNTNGEYPDLIAIDKRTNRHPLVVFASGFFNNSPNAIQTGSVSGNIKSVYTIQVASLKSTFDEVEFARRLGDIGDVFKVFYNSDIKIRVGSYESRELASSDLNKVKSRGFADAFIVMEQIVVNPAQKNPTVDYNKGMNQSTGEQKEKNGSARFNGISESTSKTDQHLAGINTTKYYVRLGAFRDTRFFNRDVWSDYELIEEKSGEFSVFLVGGFKRIEDIESVRMKALENGFRDAFIVVDYKGEKKKYR